MKKIFFTLIALVSYMSMNAQTTKLYKDGNVIAEYTDSQLDSIVFSKITPPTPDPSGGDDDVTVPDNSIVVDGTVRKINVVQVSKKKNQCDIVYDQGDDNTTIEVEISPSDDSVFPTTMQEVTCDVEVWMVYSGTGRRTEFEVKKVPVKVAWDGTTLQAKFTNVKVEATINNKTVTHTASVSYNGPQIEED